MEVVSKKSTNRRIAREYKKLLKISYQDLNDNDVELLRDALDVAIDAHKDQYRKSGEPYIFHPLAVAKIAAEKIGLDSIGIASALLHDVVEDSKYTIEDIESRFGETVAKIVSGLTKISKLKSKYNTSLILNYLDKLYNNIPLVLGETIIDDYVFCRAVGKSGKESYMVMQEKKSEKYLGGVLSIAQNLAAISKKVNLLTSIGSINNYQKKIKKELKRNINFNFVKKKVYQQLLKKDLLKKLIIPSS